MKLHEYTQIPSRKTKAIFNKRYLVGRLSQPSPCSKATNSLPGLIERLLWEITHTHQLLDKSINPKTTPLGIVVKAVFVHPILPDKIDDRTHRKLVGSVPEEIDDSLIGLCLEIEHRAARRTVYLGGHVDDDRFGFADFKERDPMIPSAVFDGPVCDNVCLMHQFGVDLVAFRNCFWSRC
jgi:hypothetical protein